MSPPRRWTKVAIVPFLVGLASGCASARVAPARAVALPVVAVSSPTRVTFDQEPRLASFDGLAVAPRRRFEIGGRRVERAAGRWVFSEEMTHEIVAAVETATGWVFVTSDGLVASSDGFTGALRRLGVVPGWLRASEFSRGRVALVAGDGLWTSDGRSLVRHETPAPVARGAFVDERRGVALTLEGERMATQDGGASWRLVRDGTEPLFWIGARNCGFAVLSARGLLSLRADGARGDDACAAGAPPAAAAQPAEPTNDEALEAWRQRHRGRPTGDEVRLRDGSTLRLDRGETGATLVRRDGGGQERSRRALPFSGRLEAWGAAALLRSGTELWRSDDGASLALVLAPDGTCEGTDLSSAQTSDDGVHLANDRCFYDGLTWRELDLPLEEMWRLSAVRGAAALLTSGSQEPRAWRVADLNTGLAAPVGLVGEAARSVCEFTLTAEGLVAGLCVAGESGGAGSATLVIGRAGSAMTSHPAPARARHVAFADARRGVATGSRAADLWRTLDGGEHWEALPLPMDGAPELTAYDARGFHARCDEDGCVLGSFGPTSMRLSGWGPLTASPDRLHLGAARHDEPVVTLRCDADAPRSLDAPRPYGEPWNRGLCQTTEGPDRRDFVLAWEDLDGASGRVPLSRMLVPRSPCLAFIAPTRNGGLFADGGLVFLGQEAASMRRHRLEELLGERGFIGTHKPLTASTASGGAVVQLDVLVQPLEAVSLGVRLVAELDADGAVLAARVFPREMLPRAAGPAFHRGRWGYATVLPDRTVRFAPLGEGEPATVGQLPTSLAPCAAPPGRDLTTAHLMPFGEGRFFATSGHDLGDERLHQFTLEFEGASACLRTLRRVDDNGALSLVAEQGRLTGTLTSARSHRAVRCEVSR